MPPSNYRPGLREVVGIFAVIAAIQVFNLVTHNDVLTAVLTIVICTAVVAWWLGRYWRQ